MTLQEARELVNGPLWPKVRDHFLASGSFEVYPTGDPRRLEYLDKSVRDEIELWMKAIPQLAAWRKVVDGKAVRQLKAEFPGVYPEALRYEAYFAGRMKKEVKVEGEGEGEGEGERRNDILKILLKLKFPEAYRLCYS